MERTSIEQPCLALIAFIAVTAQSRLDEEDAPVFTFTLFRARNLTQEERVEANNKALIGF